MPATALDPKTALVIIDLQKGLMGYPTVHPVSGILANARKLADAFRLAELPVVLVNTIGSADGKDLPHSRTEVRFKLPPAPDFGDLVPELNAQASDIRITKRQPSAFYGTELDLQLRRRGVTGIVLIGISTSSGVDTTARAAHERAYNVTFALDAITDLDAAVHEMVTTKMFPKTGEVDTTDAVIALLQQAKH